MRNTDILGTSAADIARAAACLHDGGLVALPTETVYGLGADATNDPAVAGIFEAKGRPAFNPLICHVSGAEAASREARVDRRAERLMAAFWPGALTVVLPRRPESSISLLCSAGLDSIALRQPDHPVAGALIAALGRPVAAPSANASGRISPTTAEHVLAELGGRIDLILDGGPCRVGLESTVVGLTHDIPLLLRPGGIPRDEIEAVIGPLEVPDGQGETDPRASPGMLASHYAPERPIRLDVTDPGPAESLLAFGPNVPQCAGPVLNLSPSGDLREAAANLFAMLRALDSSEAEAIAVMPIPEEGLGHAINDRLRRAAAPRRPA